MDCRNRKCCGLLVFVVQFVKVLVEERRMVDSVKPVSPIVLKERKKNRRVITVRTFFLAIHFCPLSFAVLSLYVPCPRNCVLSYLKRMSVTYSVLILVDAD
jgi:hypothetical protein